MASANVLIVSATRLDRHTFHSQTLLGRSLQRPEHSHYVIALTASNTSPLAAAYNAAIETAHPGTLVVFCHDDLDLGPTPLGPPLQEALQRFDLVGVAGNQRHQMGQTAWWLDPRNGQWDHPYLSGALKHGTPEDHQLSIYGPLPLPVQLLDGAFLAARAGVLQEAELRFDARFPFHYYDLDFCQTARRAGLHLGTWPLDLIHASCGQPSGLAWSSAQQRYLDKWGEHAHAAPSTACLFEAARRHDKAKAWSAAEQSYRELLQLVPSHGPALLQLAKVVQQQGRHPEALTLLDDLLSRVNQPARLQAKAQCNRGVLLQLQGQLDGAEQAYGAALKLDPRLRAAADNLLELALLLRAQGRSHQALQALRRILRAQAQRPDLLLQLGISLMDLGRVEAAVPCLKRLLRLVPQQREGHYQLGQALAALGQTEAAIDHLQTALDLDPTAPEVLTTLEWHRLSLCDWMDYEARQALLLERLQAYALAVDGPLLPPLSAYLVPAATPALLLQLGQRWAAPTSRSMAKLQLPPVPSRPAPERIRLGYLSADFRNHAMGNLIHGLFTHHDRQRFEVFAYSLADLEDNITAAIRNGVDHYSVVSQLSSEAIAARIRGDGITVLIDLMGHTHHSRPGVLALRPAPLQLHYLGFPGSLGADWIDGVIADGWLIPAEHEPYYQEAVHRLPWGFVSSAPLPDPTAADQPLPSRASLGLPADGVVLACFNRAEKITPVVFEGWLEILRQVPDAVLWCINDSPTVQQRLQHRLVVAVLDPGRLVFSPMVEPAVFAHCCTLADLLLDTSPYGAGATAVTALSAGLPLLTCPGTSFASRMGASLCAATGLGELICPDQQAYVATAIALGRDRTKLQNLRRQLREHQSELPLFQTGAWVKHLETLLEQLIAMQHAD